MKRFLDGLKIRSHTVAIEWIKEFNDLLGMAMNGTATPFTFFEHPALDYSVTCVHLGKCHKNVIRNQLLRNCYETTMNALTIF